MAKCTGMRCPMQYGYKVDKCNHTDCPYRTEPITNADRILAMSDEELAAFLLNFFVETMDVNGIPHEEVTAEDKMELFRKLQQPAEGE